MPRGETGKIVSDGRNDAFRGWVPRRVLLRLEKTSIIAKNVRTETCVGEGGVVKIFLSRTLAVPPEPVRAEESPAAARAPAPSLG